MLKTQKVAVSDLSIGMFVSGLDRAWLGTPFLTQGFLVETQEDISRIQQYCETVFIDRRRSAKVGAAPVRRQAMAAAKTQTKVKDRARIPITEIVLLHIPERDFHGPGHGLQEPPGARGALVVHRKIEQVALRVDTDGLGVLPAHVDDRAHRGNQEMSTPPVARDLGDVLRGKLHLGPSIPRAHDVGNIRGAHACVRQGLVVDLLGGALRVRGTRPDNLCGRFSVDENHRLRGPRRRGAGRT